MLKNIKVAFWGCLLIMTLAFVAFDKDEFLSNFGSQTGNERPPNIVIILADDLGYDDLGIHNPLFRTRNLDQMAGQSTVFSNFYVNPICAPSRASLLTGRHFLRTGVSHVHAGKDFIHLSEILLSNHLSEAGYQCGIWGKWHSGHTSGYLPWDRGFQEAYTANLYKHQHSKGLLNGTEVSHEKWADEVIVDYAIDFMKRNRDTPFLAFVSSLTPHLPIAVPDSFQEPYRHLGFSDGFAGLLGMVEHFDHQIGRLFQAIDSLDLNEQTIIVFLSDNGPQIMTGMLTEEERTLRYIGNRKGHKGDLWENGVKSPLFIKLPSTYAPKEIQALTDITDLFPTLIELAGVELPQGRHIDGKSLVPLLKENKEQQEVKWTFDYTHQAWVPSDDIPYSPQGRLNEYSPVKKDTLEFDQQLLSSRTGHYKVLTNPFLTPSGQSISSQYALFNLKEDPTESEVLALSANQLSEKMTEQLHHWWTSILSEPHAFTSPIFQIGGSTLMHKDEILTSAPAETSEGLVCTIRDIQNWKSNDRATYRVQVHREGNYRVSVKIDPRDLVENSFIHLQTSHSKVSARIKDQEWMELDPIHLATSDTTLIVSVSNTGIEDDQTILLRSMSKIVFE